MKFRFGVALVAAVVVLSSSVGALAEDAAVCERFDWPLAIERQWLAAGEVAVAESGATLSGLPERAVLLKLKPAAEVVLAAPTRVAKVEAAHSGIVSVDVPGEGLYQVTLSADGWIDVVQGGAAIVAKAHTGNRQCAGLRKSVRFALKGGTATIQVTSVPADEIRLAIRRAD